MCGGDWLGETDAPHHHSGDLQSLGEVLPGYVLIREKDRHTDVHEITLSNFSLASIVVGAPTTICSVPLCFVRSLYLILPPELQFSNKTCQLIYCQAIQRTETESKGKTK